MRNMGQLKIGLILSEFGSSLELGVTSYVSVHMVMAPPLEGSPWVVRVIAVDLDKFIENAASKIEIFIAHMFS